jgi:GT2 family glycosyltransferase
MAAEDLSSDRPLVTVAVCTRDRPSSLTRCLDALLALDYPDVELLVVDNAPATTDTERLVRESYPSVRYVCESRPGLDWARNRAIAETRREIIAFTDDDVIVDPRWVSELVRLFKADPQVMAVTGLVIPDRLDTPARRLFEIYGGFGRGFVRRWYRGAAGRPIALEHGGAGKFGTGANMAYRRRVFDEIGGFDPALDVGTVTNGGGDLEMFFRVLKYGHTLVYEPAAIVRHRHRETYAQLRTQIANNGVGFYSYLVRSALAWPDERLAFIRLAWWWLRYWNLRRLLRSFIGKERIPRDLILAELIGSFRGLTRYPRARRVAVAAGAKPVSRNWTAAPRRRPETVRRVDISAPILPIADATEYERMRLFVFRRGVAIGRVQIDHHGAVVSPIWIADAIAQQLGPVLLEPESTQPALSTRVSVSVVVATRDRPDDLARCLPSLMAQRTRRAVEIIVVDNNPASGVTRPVVARYPSVRLVEEHRTGLSYARNAGILAARGAIIVSTDDDAICEPEWLERLVAPFRRDDVMAVTGNVLPLELETGAQRLFEAYGGLGRGFERQLVDGDRFKRWRRAVPTWQLGCTANAAFRARIFSQPGIGMLNEALGPGTPTGCGEDTDLFYRVLRTGHAIAYEPTAVVWHRHRETLKGLRRQIYAYSKGHVAYHLTTWIRDGDRRALIRLICELPLTYARRAYLRLRGWSDYPLALIAVEVAGNLAGPYALWRSRRRARLLGPSGLPGGSTPPVAVLTSTLVANESSVRVKVSQ